MKCQDCEQLLEEYLDGETDERQNAAVAAHLEACAACSEIYEGLAAEQSLYASYEREVEVTPALWAGVEARLRAERRDVVGRASALGRLRGWLAPLLVAPRFSPALTAAFVVLAVAATAVVMRTLDGKEAAPVQVAESGNKGAAAPATAAPSESPTPEPSSSPASAPFSSPHPTPKPKGVRPQTDPNKAEVAAGTVPKQGPKLDKNPPGSRPPRVETAADKLVREAEQRYVAAIRILDRDVKTRRDRIDAGTRARFEETLASIDRTIAETRKTARQHGNDPVAVQYMLSAYAKKVEVMREMAALGQ